jgi:sigma-B regulation protein RsbU (phosphoserine phosphatase)
MDHFKQHGFVYTTYKLDPDGGVAQESYRLDAPFPDVTRDTIERFIEGKPWQACMEGRVAIVEVPIGGYGRLRLTASDRERYSDEELGTLQEFAGAIAMGYRRFLDFRAVEVAQQQLIEEMEKELRAAHDMQMSLLPKGPPEVPGASVSALCIPATHVGGDYYQFVRIGADDRFGVVLADVSGHGMQAATVAMRFNEILRYELRGRSRPGEVLQGLDGALEDQIPDTMFVTCGIGIWDADGRTFRFGSAGSPDLYHYAAAERVVNRLETAGTPLGLSLPDGVERGYGSAEVGLAPGDLLVLTSDGVVEARNGRDEFYEAERLSARILELGKAGASADEMRDAVTEDVKHFIGNAAQSDDITVIVMKST